jgi:2-iminobutanoate/2-iminopropanoate deaminase
MKTVITTTSGPAPIGPYSHAVAAGGLIFLSGQLPIDPATGNLVGPEIGKQTEMVLKNMGAILQSQGLTLDNVVKTTVYMADLNDFKDMNAVYARFFPLNPPARATIGVNQLPRMALVEIEAIAVK